MTPEERRLKWIEQQLGVAKLLLTLAVAVSGSLLAWTMQNRGTEAFSIIVLGFIASAGFGVAAVAILAWIRVLLRRLQEESNANN